MCPSHPDPSTNSACPQPKSSPSTSLPSPLSFLHGGISATHSRTRTLPPHQVHLVLCPFFLVRTPSRRPPLSVVLPGRSLDHQHLLVGWVTDSLQRGASASNLLTVLVCSQHAAGGPLYQPNLTMCLLCFKPLLGSFGLDPYLGTQAPITHSAFRVCSQLDASQRASPTGGASPFAGGDGVLFSSLQSLD